MALEILNHPCDLFPLPSPVLEPGLLEGPEARSNITVIVANTAKRGQNRTMTKRMEKMA